MINLLYFRIEPHLREQIENFAASSSSQKINFQTTDDIEEFKVLYAKNYFEIIIIDPSQNKVEIIDLLKKVVLTNSKLIVFSSAKIDAFEFINFNVFGFLPYPLDAVLVLTIINRCINKITGENEALQLKVAEKKFQNFISINSVQKIELIKTEDISHFEADGRYTNVYLTNGVSKMASKNLGEFQKLLNPDIFCRIHHKFIINMNNVLNILKSDGYYCEMTNNKNIPVSKRKLENLNSILNLGKTLI
ncbi:LytR/AlgR family response regulator transcription factor [Flavobacterium sp. 7A]|uniref:LytR/AlgR family response regulator transcription factor n=1 Tax=Flavobacterium sp. 7A TaxID=2940571 RepID=UPI0022273B4F|nr:LytTR family DNA-binding domain-containing protein [Flavobacterium sp. 7A]MCW2120268.1 two-component system LytT family response regulator [Flavobacterium sp. 7A]